MTDRPRIALVTGANRGIGLEVARVLARNGLVVHLGARRPEAGEHAAAALRAEGLDARFLPLDVTSPAQVAAAARRIDGDHGVLDVLVNNAAAGFTLTAPSEVSDEELRATLDTNVVGPVRVIRAMLPLLHRSPAGRIVNVSSDFGSLTLNSDPALPHGRTASLAYPVSKAALNQVTVQFAKELRGTSVTINSVDPGFSDTEMIHAVGMRSRRTAADAATFVAGIALAAGDGPHGAYLNEAGPVPW
jgi:NAD(P)-dependent dehydrogenase (short-subunit alcohol dehydrogenase family)